MACNKEAAQAIKNVDPDIKICNMDRQNDSEQYVQESIEMKSDFIQLKERADKNLNNLVENLKDHQIKINYYGTNSPDKLKMLFSAGVEFPLVDKVAEMMAVANDLGIDPVKPEY
jgi:glycerophosphoryl diester phosphodiesterase